jgi:phosphoribosyl-ATP pyrophosphohydrolase/phosphoribosyl-AMP cyclohydrolase
MTDIASSWDAEALIAQADWSKGSQCDGHELLPCVVQSYFTAKVLMLGYVSAQSLRWTHARGKMVFYSRSQHRLWCKGETSGNFLAVRGVTLDCDSDSFLAVVEEAGPACHRNVQTCFVDDGGKTLPSMHILPTVLQDVYDRIVQRSGGSDPASYTFQLLQSGRERILKKIGEEATETVIAAMAGQVDAFVQESADLIFHLLVACVELGVQPRSVLEVLSERQGMKRRDGTVPQQ